MAAEVHVGDVGTRLVVTVTDEDSEVVDLSAATELVIVLRSASGVVTEHDAVLDGDGTDGKMAYETVADDIGVAGKWFIQGRVTVGGRTFTTGKGSFVVAENMAD